MIFSSRLTADVLFRCCCCCSSVDGCVEGVVEVVVVIVACSRSFCRCFRSSLRSIKAVVRATSSSKLWLPNKPRGRESIGSVEMEDWIEICGEKTGSTILVDAAAVEGGGMEDTFT